MARNNPRPPKSKRPPAPLLPSGFFIFGLLLLAILAVALFPWGSSNSVSFDEFNRLLVTKKLKKITLVGTDRARCELRDELKKEPDEEIKRLKITNGQFTVMLPPSPDRRDLYEIAPKYGVRLDREDDRGSWFSSPLFLLVLVTLGFVLLIFLFLPRLRDPMGGVPPSFGRSTARKFDKNAKNKTTFDDVADMESAKRELQEVVDYLRSPDKFIKLGAQIPKGVLMVGPPGTGKTLLARAVAGEANANFYSINGAEFIQMFVGVGASRVRDLFKTAKENSPCLIFIDEIDAVGRMRGTGVGGGSDEREQTLNQILGEMDGFAATDAVIVIAATNRPDVLDSALLRPGRFDRHVTIDRPTWKGRLDILKIHTRNKPLGDDVDLESIARSTIGMTGADLRNLANEAALLAARHNKSRIDKDEFLQAHDRVMLGPKREELFTDADKRRIAYHEAGHALVAMVEPLADKPLRVSIIPRGRTGGVNIFAMEDFRVQQGTSYLKARLAVMLGGRAADLLEFKETDAGHQSDLQQATQLARRMVTLWGMSEKLGPMAFRTSEEHVFLGKELQEQRDFSEGTARVIDEEVSALLREADRRALEIVSNNRPILDRMVAALLANEELERKDLETLMSECEPRDIAKISTGKQPPQPVEAINKT